MILGDVNNWEVLADVAEPVNAREIPDWHVIMFI